jgi:uncharacterized protein involved in type VI secretion and phage assembly
MSERLLEKLFRGTESAELKGFAIAPGIVTNNLDFIAEGRVQVRIPSIPSFEPWARIAAVGGGSGRGFLWVPQIGDEVLVACAQNDERDAYILGGLWSMVDRPPLLDPAEFLIKRVLKTGLKPPLGHEIELDDALQSITITSSSKQKITIDPLKITIENAVGSLSISLNNETQSISITAATAIQLEATQVSIEAGTIDFKGGTINMLSTGPCNVSGLPVKIN